MKKDIPRLRMLIMPPPHEFTARGKRDVRLWLLALAFLLAGYVSLKFFVPSESGGPSPPGSSLSRGVHAFAAALYRVPPPERFVDIDTAGVANVIGAQDLDWYIGKEGFEPIRVGFTERNRQVAELRQELAQSMRSFSGFLSPPQRLQLGWVSSQLLLGWAPLGPSNDCPELASLKASSRMVAPASLLAALAALRQRETEFSRHLLQAGQAVEQLHTTLLRYQRLKDRTRLPATTGTSPDPVQAQTAALVQATDALREAADELRAAFAIETSSSPQPLDESALRREIIQASALAGLCCPTDPALVWSAFIGTLPGSTLTGPAADLHTRIQLLLTRWRTLRDAQFDDRETLRIPERFRFFATSPRGVIFEVLVWSLLGVLANLTLNGAEALRRGRYRPIESIVGWTKIAYGPALALVLCLCIAYGLIDLGGYSMRVWVLPLLAFLFGFATRRTAMVIDRFASTVLGKAAESATQDLAEKQRALQRTLAERYALPRDFAEFTRLAEDVADDVVRALASQHEKAS